MKNKLFWLIFLIFAFAQASLETLVFDDSMSKLENDLKACIQRQAIIAHNIANADIEEYEPIRFEEELEELKNKPAGYKDKVIVEEEMVKMTKNRMRHQAYLKIFNMKTKSLRTVISQGK